MLHYFSEILFSQPENLQYGLQQVFNCLTQDKELPVKVEAAVALQFLIKHQEMAQEFVQPHVKPIIQVVFLSVFHLHGNTQGYIYRVHFNAKRL